MNFPRSIGPIAVDDGMMLSESLGVMLDETARGNEFAFSCLYDELGTETYTLCLRILGTRGQADRASMETWLQVWQDAASLTLSPSPTRETILTVAFNVSGRVKSNE
jgi:RNA polymerase sigma-70 factor (ECF subfamily)